MEAIERCVSFYGGLASLVALLLTTVGGAYGAYVYITQKVKRRHQEEMNDITSIQTEMIDRIDAASTQGKRQDLFIVFQLSLIHI